MAIEIRKMDRELFPDQPELMEAVERPVVEEVEQPRLDPSLFPDQPEPDRNKAARAMQWARQQNPDAYAGARRGADNLGIRLERVPELTDKLNQPIDLRALERRAPQALKLLTDPGKAALAQDDIPVLERVERKANAIEMARRQEADNGLYGLWRDAVEFGRKHKDVPVVGWWLNALTSGDSLPEGFQRFNTALNTGMLGTVGGMTDFAGELSGLETVRGLGDDLNRLVRESRIKDPTLFDQVVSAVGSTAPFLILGMATGGAGAAMGLGSQGVTALGVGSSALAESMVEGGNVMRQVREAGGTERDAIKAGLTTGLLNMPVNLALNVLGGPGGGRLFSRLLVNAGKEGGQESIQGIISDAATRLGAAPESLSLGQVLDYVASLDGNFIKDRFSEFLVGALVGGAMGTALDMAGQPWRKTSQTIKAEHLIKALGDSARESKLNQRAPEVYQEHVEKVLKEAGAPEQVYFRARDLQTFYQKAVDEGQADPIELPELLEKAGVEAERFNQALDLDETLAIKTAQAHHLAAPLPGVETLFQDAMEQPGLMEAVVREMSEQNPDLPTTAMEEFARQAVAVGADPEEAQAAAMLAGHQARIWGLEEGKSPEEWFKQYVAGFIGPKGKAGLQESRAGKTGRLFIPGENTPRVVRYELREVGELIPSHDPESFAPRGDYPQGIQERDYTGEPEEQLKVAENSKMRGPEFFINNNPDAINGPSVVGPNGVVLGGNSRVMSTILAYKQGAAGRRYKRLLSKEARRYGLDPAQVSAMKEPVLVRAMENLPADAKMLHGLVSALNAPPTQAMGEEAQAVSRGKKTGERTLEMIGKLLTDKDATVRGLLDEPKQAREILNALTRDGVIYKTEANKYWSEQHGRITNQGKSLVESALLGAVLPDYNLLRVAPPWVRRIIGQNLDSLAKLKARGGAWDLSADLKQAVELVLDAEASTYPVEQLRAYLAQLALPGMERGYSNRALALALAMVENKPSELRAGLKAMAADAARDVPGQDSLVPLASAMESFAQHVGRIESLGQPVNPDVDLERAVEPVRVEPRFKGQKPEQVRKRFPRKIRKRVLEEFKDLRNEETGWRISFSAKNFKKAKSGSSVSDDLLAAQIEAVAALPKLMRKARLVETHPDRGGDPWIIKVHRFFVPMALDGEVYSVRLVVREYKDGVLDVNPNDPEGDIRRLRTHVVEKKISAGVDAGGIDPNQRADSRTVPQHPADTKNIAPSIEKGKPGETEEKKVPASISGDKAGGTGQIIQPLADTQLKLRHLVSGIKDSTKKAFYLPEGGKTLYQYAGTRARTAALGKLEEARKLEAAGKGREQIRKATGWHRSMDGKWRWEIDDSKAKLKVDLGSVSGWDFAGAPGYQVNVGDILDHADLFEAYPEAANIETAIKVDQLWPGGEEGGSLTDRGISVRAKSNEQALELLLHELQHWIQRKEKFARGGNPGEYYRLEAADIQGQKDQIEQLDKALEDLKWGTPEYTEVMQSKLKAINDLAAMKTGAAERAMNQYRRLAGEIEARDSADRATMTEQERQAAEPNLREDAIIKWGDEEMAYAPGQPLFQAQGSRRGAVHYLPDGRAIIQLFKSSDATTLVHELGHTWRRSLADQARRPGASRRITRDWGRMAEFVGADPADPWTEEQEEQLAQALEQYVMEGQAPHPGLRGVFEKFRRWILAIYKAFSGQKFEISDQIRGVFDRMLALDSEITQARIEAELNPILRPEDVPLSERQGYSDLAEAARAQAAQNVLERRLKAYKQHERQWKKEGKAEADQHPGHILLDTLMANGGINAISLEAFAEPGTVKKLAAKRVGLLRKQGGQDFMAAAFDMGHAPVEALELLLNTPTKGQMVDKYVAEQAAEYEAEAEPFELAASRELEALLDKEAELLEKKAGANLVKPFERVFKAEEVTVSDLEEMRFDDMKADYRRVAELAVTAYRGGKLEEAAKQKRLQAAKARKLRQAAQGRRLVRDHKRYLNRVVRFKEQPLENLGGIDLAYLEQIRGLVGRYMPLPRTIRPAEGQLGLAEFLRELPEEEQPPISQDLIEQTGPWDQAALRDRAFLKKNGEPRVRPLQVINALDIGRLTELVEAVKVLEHMGRQEKQYVAFHKQMAMEEAVAAVTKAITENFGDDIRGEVPVTVGETEGQKAKRGLKELAASVEIPEFIIRRLDAFQDQGQVWDLVFKPINDSSNQELLMAKEAGRRMREMYALVPKDARRAWGKRRSIPGLEQTLTGQEVLCAALNMGNLENREALQKGYAWSDEQLEAVKDSLSREEWDFVQGVWDYLEEFYPAIDDMYYQLFGRRMVKVLREPVQTKYGEYAGGYYPNVPDRVKSRTIERFKQREADLDAREHEFQVPFVRRGFTKARKGGKHPVLLDLSVLANHVSGAIHFITHAQNLRSVHRLIKDDLVRFHIEEAVGEARHKQLMTWLVGVARPERVLSGAGESWLKAMNDNYVVAALAYNLMTALKQPLALGQGMARVGVAPVLAAVGRMAMNPLDSFRTIQKLSPYMLNRQQSLDRDLNKVIKKGWGGPEAFGQKYLREWGFKHIGFMDALTAYPVWLAAYNQGLEKYQGVESEAVDFADMQVRNTQGSGLPKDLAKFMRGGELMRTFSVFYTFFSSTHNLMKEETAIMARQGYTPRAMMKWLYSMSLIWIIPAIVEGMMNDREEWGLQNAIWDVALFPLTTIPFARELAGGLQGFRFGGGPVGEIISQVAEGRRMLGAKDPNISGTSERAVRMLAMLPLQRWGVPGYAGLPVNQLLTAKRGAEDLIEGETEMPEGFTFLFVKRREK